MEKKLPMQGGGSRVCGGIQKRFFDRRRDTHTLGTLPIILNQDKTILRSVPKVVSSTIQRQRTENEKIPRPQSVCNRDLTSPEQRERLDGRQTTNILRTTYQLTRKNSSISLL